MKIWELRRFPSIFSCCIIFSNLYHAGTHQSYRQGRDYCNRTFRHFVHGRFKPVWNKRVTWLHFQLFLQLICGMHVTTWEFLRNYLTTRFDSQNENQFYIWMVLKFENFLCSRQLDRMKFFILWQWKLKTTFICKKITGEAVVTLSVDSHFFETEFIWRKKYLFHIFPEIYYTQIIFYFICGYQCLFWVTL